MSAMEPGSGTVVVEFFVPPQLLLHDEWESMAHDHALGMVHQRGIIPVGPSHVTTEKVPPGEQLTPGIPLAVNPLMGEVVRVRVEFMVGTQT